MIEFVHGLLDFNVGSGGQVAVFREIFANQAVVVVVQPALPGSIRMREVDLGIKVMGHALADHGTTPSHRSGAGGGTRLAIAPALQAAHRDPHSIDRVELRANVGFGNIREVVLPFAYDGHYQVDPPVC